MATLNEISYNILNLARGGESSDDDKLSLRQIKFWVDYYRAILIPKYSDFGKDIDPQLIQDMGCVALSKVDKANCPEVLWGCNIKKATIDKLINLPHNRSLTWVGLADKQTPIIMADANVISFTKDRKFTSKMLRAYLIGNDLYVNEPGETDLQYINVRGIFEDPKSVTYCDTSNNCSCITDDDEYPIPMNMIAEITTNILQKELGTVLQTAVDEQNDAR